MPERTASGDNIDPIDKATSSGTHSSGARLGVETATGPARGAEEKADEYRKWDERGREWLYGFVWFEQRRDGGIARGYMQVSEPSSGKPVSLRDWLADAAEITRYTQ